METKFLFKNVCPKILQFVR